MSITKPWRTSEPEDALRRLADPVGGDDLDLGADRVGELDRHVAEP